MGRRQALIAALAALSLSACAPSAPDAAGGDGMHRYQSYFESRDAYDAFYDAAKDDPVRERVRGAIAPHHLVVGTELASLYNALSTQRPSVVVILGPDHMGVASAAVVTTPLGYDTPYGTLDVEKGLSTGLAALPFAAEDEDAFIYEHSINTHAAFIRRSFGDVPIVPVMIHSSLTMDEAESLARTLHSTLPEDALVIASVDFSHYLPEWAADFHDSVSASTVDTFDINGLPRIEVDSPASLATLQMYLTMRGARTIAYRDHTNSASATGSPDEMETTSHLYRAFTDGPPTTDAGGIGIVFYGDSMFDRGVQAVAERKGAAYLLDAIAPEERFFIGPHLSVLNLESPITDAPDASKGPVILKSDASLAAAVLDRMNVNVLSFNNNHVYDAGDRGVQDTLAFARERELAVLHPEEPCRDFAFNRRTVSLCAFDDSRTAINTDAAAAIVRERQRTADWVVVSIHWGQEYIEEPSPRERSIATTLIDAGADAIVGHGPHVVQPIERYKDKPIAYSLGNFLFDQFEAPMKKGLILGLFLNDNGVEVTPIPFQNDQGRLDLVVR